MISVKISERCKSICCVKEGLKFVVLSFLGLTIFVILYCFSSTSKIFVNVDRSIRIKGNVTNFSSFDTINGTLSSTSLSAPEIEQALHAQLADSNFRDIVGRAFVNNFTTKDKMVSDTWHDMDISTKMRANINKYGNRVNTYNNVRQNTCALCFEHNFNYVIQNEMICKLNSDVDIDLLILIFTTHENKTSRAALRTTWLTFTKNNTAQVR